MQISQLNKEGLIYTFNVVISNAQVKQKIDERLHEIGKKVKIPGFRPGKTPVSLLKQKYAGEATEKAVNSFANDAVAQIIKENKLRQLKKPNVEVDSFDENNDLILKVTVETFPKFDVKPFNDIKLEKLIPTVENQEIDTFLNAQLKESINYIDAPKDHMAAGDDLIHIAISNPVKGKIDNEEKDIKIELKNISDTDKTNIDYLLKKEILGKKVGDSIHLNLSQHAGKQSFQGTIKKIQNPSKFSTIDDSFAKHLGYDSVSILKEETLKKINDYYIWASRFRLKRHLLDALAEQYSFDLPQSMVESEFKDIWARLQSELEEAKKTGTLEEEDDKPEEELKAEYELISQRRVRLGLLISEISNLHKISLTKEEIAQAVFKDAMNYPSQMSEVLEFYKKNPSAVEQLTTPLLEDKVVDFILQGVCLTEKKVDVPTLKKEVSEVIPGFFSDEENSEETNKGDDKKKKIPKPKKAAKEGELVSSEVKTEQADSSELSNKPKG